SCADGLAGTGLGSRLHPRRGRRQRAGAFVPRRSCGQPRVLPQLARVAVAAILALRGGEKKRTQRGVNCRACSGLGRSPGSKKEELFSKADCASWQAYLEAAEMGRMGGMGR